MVAKSQPVAQTVSVGGARVGVGGMGVGVGGTGVAVDVAVLAGVSVGGMDVLVGVAALTGVSVGGGVAVGGTGVTVGESARPQPLTVSTSKAKWTSENSRFMPSPPTWTRSLCYRASPP